MGGDPKKEMSYINEYDLAKILLDRDGITIGVSAGSINMAKDVIYRDEDENKTISKIFHPKERHQIFVNKNC